MTRDGSLFLRPKRLNPWLEYLPCIIMVVLIAGILGAWVSTNDQELNLRGSLAAPWSGQGTARQATGFSRA